MLSLILEFNKIRIIVAVVLSFILGYVLKSESMLMASVIPTIGLLLIAGASAALNQVQEVEFDKLMPRTASRPLPSGRLSVRNAYLIVIGELTVGSLMLYYGGGLLALSLAYLTLVWYNLIYTKMKRVSSVAVIPGALIGALPPVIGYVSAGGNMFDLKIVLVAFFFFMWQIPHFWLLTMMYNEDYKKADFPTILDVYPLDVTKKLTFIYALGSAIAAMFISAFNILDSRLANVLIIVSSIGLIVVFFKLYIDKKIEFNPKRYFAYINLYLLLIMAYVFVNQVW